MNQKKLEAAHEHFRIRKTYSSLLFEDALEMLPQEDDQSSEVNRS